MQDYARVQTRNQKHWLFLSAMSFSSLQTWRVHQGLPASITPLYVEYSSGAWRESLSGWQGYTRMIRVIPKEGALPQNSGLFELMKGIVACLLEQHYFIKGPLFKTFPGASWMGEGQQKQRVAEEPSVCCHRQWWTLENGTRRLESSTLDQHGI